MSGAGEKSQREEFLRLVAQAKWVKVGVRSSDKNDPFVYFPVAKTDIAKRAADIVGGLHYELDGLTLWID